VGTPLYPIVLAQLIETPSQRLLRRAGRSDVLRSLFGWLIAACAISSGEPFWFDMLKRFVGIRSTVKPHEKSQEEPSKN
jgi:hypothetical protein